MIIRYPLVSPFKNTNSTHCFVHRPVNTQSLVKIPPNCSPRVAPNRVFLVTFQTATRPKLILPNEKILKEQQDQVSNTHPGHKGSSVSHRKLRRGRKVRMWDPDVTYGELRSPGDHCGTYSPRGKPPPKKWRAWAWARTFIGSAKHLCRAPGRPQSTGARTPRTLAACHAAWSQERPHPLAAGEGRSVPLTPAMSLELGLSLLPAFSKSHPHPD